ESSFSLNTTPHHSIDTSHEPTVSTDSPMALSRSSRRKSLLSGRTGFREQQTQFDRAFTIWMTTKARQSSSCQATIYIEWTITILLLATLTRLPTLRFL